MGAHIVHWSCNSPSPPLNIDPAIPSSSSTYLEALLLWKNAEPILSLSLQQILTVVSDTLILSNVEKADKHLAIQAVVNHGLTQMINLMCSLTTHVSSSSSYIQSATQEIL